MNRGMLIVFFIGALLSTACMEEMDPVSLVNKFRVMAVQADPPEIRPGEGTTHRVLFSDPEGDGREIQIAWFTCLGRIQGADDLSMGAGAEAAPTECAPIGGDFGVVSGEVAEYQVPPVPMDALDDLPEGETFVYATTVVLLCAGGTLPLNLDSAESFGDDAELCEGGEGLTAVKTFLISDRGESDRNANPVIDTMALDDEPLAEITADTAEPEAGRFVCEDTEACLKGVGIDATLTEESYQSYEQEVLGKLETIDEDPYISWFITGGHLNVDRSRAAKSDMKIGVKWQPPMDGGGRYTLFAVTHDLRGGTSWNKYAIEAVTPD